MVEVREVQGDDLHTATRVFELALGEEFGDDGRAAWLGYLESSRCLGAVVDDRVVATATAYPAQVTTVGGLLAPVHCVTGVGTLPTHVRRGFARQLLVQQLQEARQDGAVACVLESSEATLYGRYGYGPATTRGIVAIAAARAQFRASPEVSGHFDYADGTEAVAHHAQPVFDAWRRTRPGQVSRPPHNWAMLLVDVVVWRGGAGPLSWVFHVGGDGAPDGYVAYRITSRWEHGSPASEAKVVDLVATDPEVRAALLRFVLDQPLVAYLNLPGVTDDDPLFHRLVDRRAVRTVQRDDGLWVRIVDVAGAFASRSWAFDAELVVAVADDVLPDVAGTWRVVVREGRAEASRDEDADPDLRLGVAELGMLWLGGVTARTLADAGRLWARDEAVLSAASLLFRGEVQPDHVGEF